jgi:hypothetical protein
MEKDKIQVAYERLALMHMETMNELTDTYKRMDAMSHCWWPLFLHWCKLKLRLVNRHD